MSDFQGFLTAKCNYFEHLMHHVQTLSNSKNPENTVLHASFGLLHETDA